MNLIHPFAGLRPAPGWAADIAAPPYDVVTVGEIRETLAQKPHSFLRVSRADACFPDGSSPYSAEVYAAAARHFAEMLAAGHLVREARDVYYVYRMVREGHIQTGVVATVSADAYADGRIRRHELTRPDKEDDRVRQIEAVGAVTGPVMLVNRPAPQLAEIMARVTACDPVAVLPELHGVRHELWVVSGRDEIASISETFNGMDSLYIADGHHRSAAGYRVVEARHVVGTRKNPGQQGFTGVIFPSDEVQILGYHRLIRDLGDFIPGGFLAVLGEHFEIEQSDSVVRPDEPESFGMCLDNRWFRLQARSPVCSDDPVENLAVSRLTALVLEPLLKLGDPRLEPRIDFVGGDDGPGIVAARIASGEMAVGFTLCPVTIEELMAVADAGRILPPKTTWFEPKLADGMISLPLD